MARYSAPRGTEDLLPDRIPLFDWVTGTCRVVLERHGYLEIRPPLFEDTALFERSLGEVTDVVEKEMFTCTRGDTSVTFRPEATAGVVRAYLEHGFDKTRPFRKLYYIGPMFRFERPQKARQRQFWQVGIEAIGSSDPRLDAEVIHAAGLCLEALGLKGFVTHVNSIGDGADRGRFRDVLRDFVRPNLDRYCEECRRRFERNVFRVLDCKVETCRRLNQGAPAFLDHASQATREHFDAVQQALSALGRAFEVDRGLARGFDYYTRTVFEIKVPGLGARDTIVGGGRYDDLVTELGGPPTPAVGFSIGVTGTMLALEAAGIGADRVGEPACPVFVVAASDSERLAALLLADELRQAGVTTDVDYEGKSAKGQFRQADKRQARVVLVLGEAERARGVVQVKDMRAGTQTELPLDGDLAHEVTRLLESQGAQPAPRP